MVMQVFDAEFGSRMLLMQLKGCPFARRVRRKEL
jgi:hypothetical protein